ncbi:MAG: hypothetical protein WCT16_03495 [Candidatus Buchananbacteria bacterium]
MPEEKSETKKEKISYFKIFLMIIGIITIIFIFLVILLFIYLVISRPLGIDINPFNTTGSSNYDHPLLSPSQEKILQTLGVDLESIPTTITPVQEQCSVEVLGQDRVNQIKSGAAPSLNDYLKAKSCF